MTHDFAHLLPTADALARLRCAYAALRSLDTVLASAEAVAMLAGVDVETARVWLAARSAEVPPST